MLGPTKEEISSEFKKKLINIIYNPIDYITVLNKRVNTYFLIQLI